MPKAIILAAILSTFFISCHDEQDPPSISGSWKLVELDGSGTMSAADRDHIKPDSFIYSYTYIGTELNINLELAEEPNNYSETGNYTVEQTIDSMGTTLTETITHFLSGIDQWHIEEDTIFISQFFTDRKIEIIGLTTSMLKVKEHLDYYFISPEYPYSTHFIETEIRTYKRN